MVPLQCHHVAVVEARPVGVGEDWDAAHLVDVIDDLSIAVGGVRVDILDVDLWIPGNGEGFPILGSGVFQQDNRFSLGKSPGLLESAVPPITATPIVTERAGGNKSISNQFVFSSFVFSVISIPAIFHLFSQFFPMPL